MSKLPDQGETDPWKGASNGDSLCIHVPSCVPVANFLFFLSFPETSRPSEGGIHTHDTPRLFLLKGRFAWLVFKEDVVLFYYCFLFLSLSVPQLAYVPPLRGMAWHGMI
jgi:hypothetical protein